VVLIVEDYVPASNVAAAFKRAGLARRATVLHRGRPLPTLGALLAAGNQLVVFSESCGSRPGTTTLSCCHR
jgi:hypothetical protein